MKLLLAILLLITLSFQILPVYAETLSVIGPSDIVLDSNIAPESVSTETVPESVSTETVPESVSTETLPESAPESVSTETVPESVSTETVPESVSTETLPESAPESVPTEELLAVENHESDVTLHSLDLPGDPSGLAAYNMATGNLLFTTFLVENIYQVSDDAFGHNGDYIIFRTTDDNWCSDLTIEQCAATSTAQTTVNVTSIIEVEAIVVTKSEIISAEMMPDDFGREGTIIEPSVPVPTPEELIITDTTPDSAVGEIQVQTPEIVTSSDIAPEQISEPIAPPAESVVLPSVDGVITKEENNESQL